MYAEVVVSRPTHYRPPTGSEPQRDEPQRSRGYTYRLPERLSDGALVGQLVQVPLRASTSLGVVIGLSSAPPPDILQEHIRDVGEILDPLPVVTTAQIDLAKWIADEYLAPLNLAIRLMLPPGLEERTFIVVSEATGQEVAGLTVGQSQVLRILRRHGGSIRLSALKQQLRAEDFEPSIDLLADRGLIRAHHQFVPPKPAPPRIQYVGLLADDRAIQASLPRLGRPSKLADVLLFLAEHTDAPITLRELCARVVCTPRSVRVLAERGWVELAPSRTLIAAASGSLGDAAERESASPEAVVLSALREHGGPIEHGELLQRTGLPASTVGKLEKQGLVQRIVDPPLVFLSLPPGVVLDKVIELRGGELERAVLEALRGAKGRVWVGGLYAQTGAKLPTLRRLAARGLISLHSKAHDQAAPPQREGPVRLSPAQEASLQEVARGLGWQERQEAPFVGLLLGMAGSGKTEVYLGAIEAVLSEGKRAIVLVPEISLITQTVRRFEARFPGRVALLHSQLSAGQRYEVWDRVRQGAVDVLIGPRSALFAPMSRLGLIVVDEAQDESYKQDQPIPLPAYHSVGVAAALGRLTGAAVVLGSATPDIVVYHRAVQGTYRLLELPHRAVAPCEDARPQTAARPTSHSATANSGKPVHRAPQAPAGTLPPVLVIDLRQELRAGNRSIFSRSLQEALRQTLAAGEQAILFLNRRGTGTFVLCRDCGCVARCPRCDIPLTYHRQVLGAEGEGQVLLPAQGFEGLICHRCSLRQPMPSRCPECGGSHIRYFGLGTERVQAELQALCPKARLIRWDRDTASAPDREQVLQAFVERRADVLLGTQMVARGLDLPSVTLVGLISADTSLDLPDYRSPERTFQLLCQLAGRAAGSRGGRVIVQTYHPEHYAMRCAAEYDLPGFYRQELGYRRQLGYPPFSRLVALRFSDPDAHRAKAEGERLARWLTAQIQRQGLSEVVIGPAPCFFARVKDRYRWQIVVRSTDPARLFGGVALPWGWHVDVDPVSLL